MDWLEVIKLLLSALGVGGVVGGILNRKLSKIAKEKADEKANCQNTDKALKVLLRRDIYDICNNAKKRTYIWLYELEQLDEAFETYSALGGNGAAKKVYYDVKHNCRVITDPAELA